MRRLSIGASLRNNHKLLFLFRYFGDLLFKHSLFHRQGHFTRKLGNHVNFCIRRDIFLDEQAFLQTLIA